MGSTSVSHPPASDPLRCCLLGLEAHRLDSCHLGRGSRDPLESQTPEKSLLFASHVEACEELGKRSGIERFGWLAFFSSSIYNVLPSQAGPLLLGKLL